MLSNQLPTDYQQFIHKSRYAKWIPEAGRRENWDETVARYMDYFQGRLSARNNYVLSEQERNEVEQAVLNLEVMPSMRAMMTAGKALERDGVAGYNPVVGSTKVLTKELGMVEISSLSGSSATVLNVDGNWATAEFRSYGVQETFLVKTKLNSNTINEVECTANHRWILEDGTVVHTDELKSGDNIPFVSLSRSVSEESVDYKLGIKHGIIYGDGTSTYSCERVKGYMIRICGDHQDMLPYFDGYSVSYSPSNGGDPLVTMYDWFCKNTRAKGTSFSK